MSGPNSSSPPWRLACPWCPWYIVVNNRGAHGADSGSGVEAARLMEDHAIKRHARDWRDFLYATSEERLASR